MVQYFICVEVSFCKSLLAFNNNDRIQRNPPYKLPIRETIAGYGNLQRKTPTKKNASELLSEQSTHLRNPGRLN